MNRLRSAIVPLAILVLALLAGCGNKGDLVRPPPPAEPPAAS